MQGQNAGMYTQDIQQAMTGSAKYQVIEEPPKEWAERPLKRRGREMRDPVVSGLSILLVTLGLLLGLLMLIMASEIPSEEDVYLGLGIIGSLFAIALPGMWVVRRLRNRMYQVKPEQLITESYGDACILRNIRCRKRRIRIPDTYRGMKLIAAEGGFLRKTQYDTVVFPEEMERLAPGLFMGCKSLTQVQLPHRMAEVPPSLMERCPQLRAIVVPMSARRIGSRAFAGCRSLRDVYITAATTEIAEDAFVGCTDIMFHVQPGSVAEQYARDCKLSYSYKYS